MSGFSAFAVYFVIWWTVLFAILPIGIRSQQEAGEVSPGSEPGAPALPHMLRKVMTTTWISALVFMVLWFGYVRNVFGLAFIEDMRL